MNIEYWRTEIDELDRELLRLVNRRARLAMKVGALKRAAGLPCCDPERERAVLRDLQNANAGPLNGRAVNKIFRRIIRESRDMETKMLVGEEERVGTDNAASRVAIKGDALAPLVGPHEVLL
ncbi:MAG: chorismate mutase [Pyrinomonadaceae bacterium]|nr:chorismate mutase [Pyrinomonadaceae bacterium]